MIFPGDWDHVALQTDDEEINEIFKMLHDWLSQANESKMDMFEIYQAMTLVGLVNVFHMSGPETKAADEFMKELKQIVYMLLDHYNEQEEQIKH